MTTPFQCSECDYNKKEEFCDHPRSYKRAFTDWDKYKYFPRWCPLEDGSITYTIKIKRGLPTPSEVAATHFMTQVMDLAKESGILGQGLSITRDEE